MCGFIAQLVEQLSYEVGRASHRYRGGHGFFFPAAKLENLLRNDDHSLIPSAPVQSISTFGDVLVRRTEQTIIQSEREF